MSVSRKKHSNKFKSKVAIAAIKGDKTIKELSQEYQVAQSRVLAWKKKALEGMPSLFDPGAKIISGVSEAEVEKLYIQIGKLQVERDFLKKNLL